MQSRKAKAIRIQNKHHRGIGDVNAHLDDRRRDEDVELALTKVIHDRILVGRRQASVQKAYGKSPQRMRELTRGGGRGVQLLGGGERLVWDVIKITPVICVIHEGADDVGLPSHLGGLADGPPGEVEVLRRNAARLDPCAGLRTPRDAGTVEVSVEREGKRPRYGRRRHGEEIRARPLASERRPLVDPKAMLLVYHNEAEMPELKRARQERRRPEDDADLPFGHALTCTHPLRLGGGAREERPADLRGVEQWPKPLGILVC